MSEMTPAQQKCYDALKAYGRPYAGGHYSSHRDALPGFKIGTAEAMVRKGILRKEWSQAEKVSYYMIAE